MIKMATPIPKYIKLGLSRADKCLNLTNPLILYFNQNNQNDNKPFGYVRLLWPCGIRHVGLKQFMLYI